MIQPRVVPWGTNVIEHDCPLDGRVLLPMNAHLNILTGDLSKRAHCLLCGADYWAYEEERVRRDSETTPGTT